MLGEFFKRTETGIFILMNEKPYWTTIGFIENAGIKAEPVQMVRGDKISFNGHEIRKENFKNCCRCYKQLSDGEVNI